MDNVKLVVNTMKKAKKELKSGEIAELAAIDKKEVTKIINQLKKEGKVISPKRCYYKIK